MVSFPLHCLWHDVHAAVRMLGHPVIGIIGPKEHRQDKDHAQRGPVPGCGRLPVLVRLLTPCLCSSLAVEAHFKHKP